MDIGQPIDGEGGPTALLFAEDPEIEPLQTENGTVEFVQVIGLHAEELTALKAWHSGPFIEVLRERSPLLLTDPARRSLLEDPEAAKKIQEGIERDGSSNVRSMGDVVAFTLHSGNRKALLSLGPVSANVLRESLDRLVRRGKPSLCTRPGEDPVSVVFVASESPNWSADKQGAFVVRLTPPVVDALEQRLVPGATFELPELPGLTFQAHPEKDPS